MRAKWLVVAVGAVVLVGGGAALLTWKRKPPAPPPVQQQRPVFQGSEISLPGTIQASSVVPVAAPVEGTLEAVAAGPGQDVYEGQLLGRVRNVGIERAQEQATAELERAQERARGLESGFIAARLEASRARADATRVRGEYDRISRVYQRQQMLLREGATARQTFERSKKEFDTAELEYSGLEQIARQAEERAANIQKEIDRTKAALQERERELDQVKENATAAEIHSPANGFIVAVTKREGEDVTPEVKDVFRIAVNLALLEAVVEPEPPALARIRPGQEASLSFVEFADIVPGRVKEIRNGSQVVIEFSNPSPAIRPGQSAQVRVRLD